MLKNHNKNRDNLINNEQQGQFINQFIEGNKQLVTAISEAQSKGLQQLNDNFLQQQRSRIRKK